MAELKRYRIPAEPVGLSYYRHGTQYPPGSVVAIPADEVPAGWTKQKDGSMRPTGRHAWKLIEPGKKEASDEKLTRLEEARKARAEAAKQLEESARLLEELEGEEEAAPRRGVVKGKPEEPDEPDEETPEPKDPGVEDLDAPAEGGEKKKGKGGRKAARTKDPEL